MFESVKPIFLSTMPGSTSGEYVSQDNETGVGIPFLACAGAE